MEELDSVFWIRINGVFYGKTIEEIAYFKSMWPWVKMVAVDEEFCFWESLAQVQKRIEKQSQDFIRVSRRYYINVCYVKDCTSKEIRMMDGTVISVNRKNMEYFREKVHENNE
ncbi:MAG: LytTR family transcriptional regulator [Eubacterium sp.]|nr:LytTR family transcriptional regulator [Eubacterium sp.]